MTDKISLIDKQIMWNRLIAVVEEQAQVLQRTAFSTICREAGDLSAGVFNRQGLMLAQAVTGTPGHINSMALAVGHVIEKYPVETMQDGDVFIHNDPWMGTGHLHDFVLTTPCFYKGELIGLFSCTTHIHDIGGSVAFLNTSDVFQEGLYIPILKIVSAGKVDKSLMALIRANTREPVETEGDTYSLISCNDVGCRRLQEMMAEFNIDDLEELSEHIITTSRDAVLAEIAQLPKGTWHNELTVEGFDSSITLKAALTVSDTGIHIDFTGSSPITTHGPNVPICYTLAYTAFGLGCIVARNIPNNAGSLEPITVSAPVNSVVNAQKPAAVFHRGAVGMFMPDLAFGCLRQAIPDRVPAENTSTLWFLNARAPRQSPGRLGDDFAVQVLTNGGMGALPQRDGLSATGYPSGVRGGPIEIFESMSSMVVWRKEYRQDSGGAGKTRGGLGQVIELGNSLPESFAFRHTHGRILYPPRGYFGGVDGAPGFLGAEKGAALTFGGKNSIAPGDRLVMLTPGGGGLGDPKTRDRALVEADLEKGLISAEVARDVYGYEPMSA